MALAGDRFGVLRRPERKETVTFERAATRALRLWTHRPAEALEITSVLADRASRSIGSGAQYRSPNNVRLMIAKRHRIRGGSAVDGLSLFRMRNVTDCF
jgi:hypothetical protein